MSRSIPRAINLLRYNKSLLRKKSMFKPESSFLRTKREYYKAAEGKVNIKQATPEELHLIRKKVLKNQKRELLKVYLVFGIVLLTLGFFVLKNQNVNEPISQYAQLTYEKDQGIRTLDQYEFYISDGDEWLEKKHWHNAIFQYKKALELFPSSYDANYRLAVAYNYRCLASQSNCDESIARIAYLHQKYPQSEALYKLQQTVME